MESNLSLLRIRGVPVGVHWSWVFVAALVVLSLATAMCPATYPGLAASSYLLMAIVAGLLFFASILLHELGHTVEALRELPTPPPSSASPSPAPGSRPRSRVASGWRPRRWTRPALRLPCTAWPTTSPASTSCSWRSKLAPALPLDGGGALHAWLWRRQGNQHAATLSAAAAGRAFAFVLIGIGLLGLFTGDGAGSIWIAFIGWFLLQAAQSEAGGATTRHVLGGHRVSDAMAWTPVTVPADLVVADFVDRGFPPPATAPTR